MNKLLLSISFIIAIVAFQSCDKTERTLLTNEEKTLLDSLYAKRVSIVRKKADSICKARYQTTFNAAKDSFYEIEVREIKAILNGEG